MKKLSVIFLTVLMIFAVGCAEEFEPASVQIEYGVDKGYFNVKESDSELTVREIWKYYEDEIEVTEKVDSDKVYPYIYLRFFDEDKKKSVILTVFDDGTCCIGDDMETTYTVTNGRNVYLQLCEFYEDID